MAGGAAKVHQSARCQDNHTVAIREDKAVHLRLDVLNLDAREILQVLHGNLVVKVADVAHNGVVLHLLHVIQSDDLEVASGGSENVHLTHALLNGNHLEAFHASLQSADGINFRDEDSGTSTPHGEGAALSDISVACHKGALAANHHIGGAHDAVWQRVPATIDVVELGLGHAVVHVDGREEQLTLGGHLTKAVHSGSRLLANALALGSHSCVFGLVRLDGVPQHLQDTLELSVGGAGWVGQAAVLGKLLLQLLALVNQQGGITSIIHQLVASISTWYCHHLLSAPPILLQGLTLPCKDSGSVGLGNGSSSMILSAEDVA
mmetsp:Transcript_66956/g.105686  ORF Transcript_66956/g.105686 Transcript_66956/m.105686 type:complete len:320 (-) Transcript_66956:273-1232(-)